MKRSLLTACAAFLLAFNINFAAADAKPPVLPVSSHAYGMTYAEWSAAWLKWAVSIPASSNPLLDDSGVYAAVGQSGKVWFLAGTTGSGNVPPVVREISIPAGTPLFFPIINSFWLNTPPVDPEWSPEQEAYARSLIAASVDTAYGLNLKIDKRSVSNLSNFRVKSVAAKCTVPADNIFGVDLVNNPYDCVADGYWVMIPPLSVGSHTIHFKGGLADSQFFLDVTYKIKVKPEHKHDHKHDHKIEMPHHP
jgi:hypothetical protein